jgi:hypothetical protein
MNHSLPDNLQDRAAMYLQILAERAEVCGTTIEQEMRDANARREALLSSLQRGDRSSAGGMVGAELFDWTVEAGRLAFADAAKLGRRLAGLLRFR